MIKIKLPTLLLFLCVGPLGYSQVKDTSILLRSVEVFAEREKFFSDSHKAMSADSLLLEKTRFSTLAELIDWELPLNIRRYGSYASVANISLRGSSASQVQVNWNGFPVNSIAVGTANLSNIFNSGSSQITAHWGTAGSLFGSALGAINIENKANWAEKNKYVLFTELGSFSTQKYGTSLRIGNDKVQYQINARFHKSDGDFSYKNTEGVKEKRKHNSLIEKELSQFLFFRLSTKETLDFGFSYLHKNLSLPNSLLLNFTPSQQSQRDRESRLFAKWKKQSDKGVLQFKSAYFSTLWWYKNPAISYELATKTQQFFTDLSYRYYASPIVTLDVAGKYSYQKADIKDYKRAAEEHNFSLLLASKFNLSNLVLNLSTRVDFYDKKNPNPQFSLGGKYKLLNGKLQLSSSLSTQYRLPTFNDKYWTPGGNENLLPEKAFSTDIGVKYDVLSKDKATLNISAHTFYTQTKDYILWQAVEKKSYFAPVNIGKVRSRGGEISARYRQQILNLFELKLHSSYTLVYAKDKLKNKPLHYIPKHEFKNSFRLQYRGFYLINSLQYRNDVTTSDFTENLDEYIVWDILGGKNFNFSKFKAELIFKIYNVTNTNYQQVLGYPLPLRYYRVGLIFHL